MQALFSEFQDQSLDLQDQDYNRHIFLHTTPAHSRYPYKLLAFGNWTSGRGINCINALKES